tara:strand:+ start:280 stop:723 length:444 start_codon:yes stop_codon:yes gene_type:complete
MSKVGRAAYAASRARLELVTADKTISKNESGELYAIDAGGAVAITLPTDPESGTRYKFMIVDDVTGGGAVTIVTQAARPFQGAVAFSDSDGANTDVVKADGDAANDDVLTLQSTTEQGSWVICVYDADNTRWLVEGWVSAATAPTFA